MSLIIGVLFLFSNIAERIDNVDKGSNGDLEIAVKKNNVSSTFLDQNFNQTNGDQRYWYDLNDADRMLKNKADILSRLFKMHIDQLRNKTDQVD